MNDLTIGILAGFVSSLIAGYLIYLITNRENDVRVKIKEFNSETAKKENLFYRHYRKAVEKTKIEIVQYAEGFNTELPERLEIAEKIIEWMRTTLDKKPDVKWIRYQTKTPHDEKWKNLLNKLSGQFPRQFKLMLINNRLGDHLASITLMDPGTRRCKIFFLIARPKYLGGTTKVYTADTAIMITGAKSFSRSLREQLDELQEKLGDTHTNLE